MEWMNSNLKEIEPTNISNQEQKEKIAKEIAQKVKDGDVIGFGSGSTSYLAIKEIAKIIEEEELHITAIPTSYEIKALCHSLNIPTVSILEKRPDWAFDGADEVDKKSWKDSPLCNRYLWFLHSKVLQLSNYLKIYPMFYTNCLLKEMNIS